MSAEVDKLAAARDIIGLAICSGDRVWLLGATSTGFARLASGTVLDVTPVLVTWRADPMTPEEWARECLGCDLTSRGAYAPPNRLLSGGVRMSRPSILKVVAKGRTA